MKSIIISSFIVLSFIAINVWMLSYKSPQLSKEDYKTFMETFPSANETVMKIEKFLLELPKMKNRDDIDKYEFYQTHKNDSLIEIENTFGKEDYRIENLRIKINEDGSIDTVEVALFNSLDYKKSIILPKISNVELDKTTFDNYYSPPHILWIFFISLFILMIITSSVYYKIKRIKVIQNSLITFLISILILNITHIGFYQKYEFYRIAEDIMSFGLMENYKIISPLTSLNIMAYNTQIFASVFDVSIISIIILSVVLILKLNMKKEV